MNNPLLLPFNTPHETVPFHLIKIEHFESAILEGMQAEDNEIAAIVTNPESPTFGNTILALENSGKLLERTLTIPPFATLTSPLICSSPAPTNTDIYKWSFQRTSSNFCVLPVRDHKN